MHVVLAQFYSSQPTPDYDKIAAALRRQGHRAWVATPNAGGDIEWWDGQYQVGLQPMPDGGGRSARIQQFRQVRAFLRQEKPDIVQINATGLLRMAPLWMPEGQKYILDVRQINEQHGANLITKARAAYLNTMRGVYSRRVYDRTTFLHPAGAEKVLGPEWRKWADVVPMGVDPHFLTVSPPSAAERAPGDPVRFIYIGRLTRRRLLERIIKAADLVRQKNMTFCVMFMGYDATGDYYKGFVKELGLEDQVTFKHPVPYEEVPAIVQSFDVALAYVPELPADWKYHPTLKVLEYRALGVPIIASDFAPNRDVVTDGLNGLLVENTVEDIAAAMLRFIEDPAFLAGARRNAESTRQGVVWEDVARQYVEQVYTPLLARRD